MNKNLKKQKIIKEKTLGAYFEEFEVGDFFEHSLSKTIFESDNNFFCLLTMNYHPVHTNVDYAQKNKHEKILVVGTLVFSLTVGISVLDISGKAIACLSYDKVEHLAPVFIGDTIYAKTKVIEKKENKNSGLVSFETIAFNQDGQDVLKFKRTLLIKKRG